MTEVHTGPGQGPPSHSVSEDTEQVEGAGHVDDCLPGLGFLPRSKLDDLLRCLQKLRHPRPRVPPPRTLEAESALVSDRCLTGTTLTCTCLLVWEQVRG